MKSATYLAKYYPGRDVFTIWDDSRGLYSEHSFVGGDSEYLADLTLDIRMFVKAKQLKLNDEYTAIIEGDEVVVGCQRFPKSKVLELAKLIQEK